MSEAFWNFLGNSMRHMYTFVVRTIFRGACGCFAFFRKRWYCHTLLWLWIYLEGMRWIPNSLLCCSTSAFCAACVLPLCVPRFKLYHCWRQFHPYRVMRPHSATDLDRPLQFIYYYERRDDVNDDDEKWTTSKMSKYFYEIWNPCQHAMSHVRQPDDRHLPQRKKTYLYLQSLDAKK